MFEEAHENLEGLRRVFAGEASPVEAERVAVHLTGCRPCWLLATRAIAAQKASGVIAAQGPIRPLIDLHEIEQARLEEWLEAQAIWIEVRSLTPKARRDKVRLTRTLHTLSFLEVLLEEGASATPAESEEFFYLALLVSQQLPSPRVSVELKNDLCAECCAEMANARRRAAKWTAARDALKKGLEYAGKGSRNGVAEGKVLSVAGALEDDLGSTEEAVSTLRRAAGLFESAKQTFLLSRTLTQLAYVLVGEDPAESLQFVEQALSLIPDNSPRLLWFAETAKVDCLIGIGAPQEALIRYNAMKALNDQFREPFIQLRRRFNAAKLLENLGSTKRAETLFQEVIAGDLEHGLVKDFFLDLVYLFGFYLRRGLTSEAIAVCRRASQELSLLDDEEGSAETARDQMRMVWRSLEEEVKRGTVDLGATKVLRNYIKAHWRFPATDPPSFGGRPTKGTT
jgi:tetratricopeptide (TPR) repeat protein